MDSSNKNYLRAKRKIESIKRFYNHLTVYIIVNIMLFIINLLFTPGTWWFIFPLIFWGVGVLTHFLEVFIFDNKFFTKKWEKKKFNYFMEKE